MCVKGSPRTREEFHFLVTLAFPTYLEEIQNACDPSIPHS